MEYVTKDFLEDIIKEQISGLVRDIGGILDKRFSEVDVRFDRLEVKMDKLEQRIGSLEERVGVIENRLDKMDERFEEIDRHFGQIDRNFASLHMKIEATEENMAIIVNKAFQEMRDEMDSVKQEQKLNTEKVVERLNSLDKFTSDLYDNHERRILLLENA